MRHSNSRSPGYNQNPGNRDMVAGITFRQQPAEGCHQGGKNGLRYEDEAGGLGTDRFNILQVEGDDKR